MRKVLMMLAVSLALIGGVAAAEPVWDLAKSEFAGTKGKVERQNGTVRLDGGNAFAIPNSAFPDPNTFTVEISLRINKLPAAGKIMVFDKKVTDTGFSLAMHAKKGQVNLLPLLVNERQLSKGWLAPTAKMNGVWTAVLAARDGLVSLYQGGYSPNANQVVVVPNLNDLWVGTAEGMNAGDADIEVLSLKVYAADLKYYAKGEDLSKMRTATRGGKGWNVRVPVHPDAKLPNVYYYGDSISLGYSKVFDRLLDGCANGYHHVGFTTDPGDFSAQAMQEAVSVAPMDIVVFNNGLHSLHWTEQLVPDDKVREVYRGYVKAYRAGAPKAKIFYVMTTPFTAKGKPVKGVGGADKTVTRLNRLAAEVMKEENVPVIDMYGLMIQHLDLAAGDTYHWTPAGYKMIAETILQAVGLDTPAGK